jgi:serine/threonine protein kinase
MPTPISAEQWPRVKALFFAAQEAPTGERARLVGESSAEPAVRDYVLTLLDAADDCGDRFERPAMAAVAAAAALTADGGGDLCETPPALAGRRVGPYQVLRRIGQGGMGAVYEAVRADGAFEQRVALKTLWRGADSQVLARRFRTERQILAGLQHPHIARLLDGGATQEGMPYLVMELVDGEALDAHCDRLRLGLSARLALFLQVCAAVQHAHGNLVVHRDLKPSNVLVTAEGTVKLLDFGVAKLLDDPRAEGTLTSAGLVPFTAAYAAPEQVTGGAVSTATDVYALGALLMVLLVGRPPFADDALTPTELLVTVSETPAPAPSQLALVGDVARADAAAAARGLADRHRLARALQGELDAIALMALRKEPSRRYATVDALAADVQRHLRRERVLARPDTLGYRLRTVARRRRALVVGGALAVASLVTGSALALWQARASRLEAARSEHVAEFLTRMLGTSDVATGAPFVRLGARGTVAQLLDSVVRRVPATFPDDPRVRARLYTAIGSHYLHQGRGRDARPVLDSAVRLALGGYGPRSDAYAEASLEAAGAMLYGVGPVPAERHVRAALGALEGRERERAALHARALGTLAILRVAVGSLREADSLARLVIELETARTSAPTMPRAWALRVLGHTSAWERRDPDVVVSIYRHALAVVDSLGTPLALERLEALDGLADALMFVNRLDAADSMATLALHAAHEGYGTPSMQTALASARLAQVVRARGDSTRATRLADSAYRMAAAMPHAHPTSLAFVGALLVRDHLLHGRAAAADGVAERLAARVMTEDVPIAAVYAALHVGLAKSAREDWPAAEQWLRRGLAALPPSGDMDTMQEHFRLPLAEALRRQGRAAAADSVLAALPARVPRVMR